MRTTLWSLLIFTFLLPFFTPEICQARSSPLRVVTEEWPPYNYTEDNELRGVVTAIVRATLNRASLDYNIQSLPWARAYHTALHEKNVLIYTIFKLDRRADKFQWIKINGLSTEMYLFRPANRTDIQASTLEQAKKYRIGVTRETSTHQFLRDHGFTENINIFPVANEKQNILQADTNIRHIDLTTGDRLSIAHWLKKLGYPTNYLRKEAFLFKQDFYMALSLQTNPALVQRVKRAFESISNDGTLDQIIQRYREHYGLEDEGN